MSLPGWPRRRRDSLDRHHCSHPRWEGSASGKTSTYLSRWFRSRQPSRIPGLRFSLTEHRQLTWRPVKFVLFPDPLELHRVLIGRRDARGPFLELISGPLKAVVGMAQTFDLI